MAGGGCGAGGAGAGAGVERPVDQPVTAVAVVAGRRRTATRRLSVFVSPLVLIIEKNKGGGEEGIYSKNIM